MTKPELVLECLITYAHEIRDADVDEDVAREWLMGMKRKDLKHFLEMGTLVNY